MSNNKNSYWDEPVFPEKYREFVTNKIMEKIDIKEDAYYCIDVAFLTCRDEENNVSTLCGETVWFFNRMDSFLDIGKTLKLLSKKSAGYFTLCRMEPKQVGTCFGYAGIISCKDGKTIDKLNSFSSMDYNYVKKSFREYLKNFTVEELCNRFDIKNSEK